MPIVPSPHTSTRTSIRLHNRPIEADHKYICESYRYDWNAWLCRVTSLEHSYQFVRGGTSTTCMSTTRTDTQLFKYQHSTTSTYSYS
eukprot:scaffold8528_cov36-Prasinocladus_malaysianus.AAC.2